MLKNIITRLTPLVVGKCLYIQKSPEKKLDLREIRII